MSSGLWIVLGAAVGGLMAIVGGFVERASRSRGELVRAAAAWMAATEALAQAAAQDALYATPPSNRVGEGLEWLANLIEGTLGKGRVELLRALVHRPLVRRVETVADRVWETLYAFTLQAPPRLLRDIEPHVVALGQWLQAPSDQRLREQWENVGRGAVARAIRRHAQPWWRRLLQARDGDEATAGEDVGR